MADFVQFNRELYDLYMEAVGGCLEDADDRLQPIHQGIGSDAPEPIRQTYLNFSRLISGYSRVDERLLTFQSAVPANDHKPQPTLLGNIEPGGLPGVSLVTCAMNRTENLLKALKSWLAHAEITEVVIVDWSSRLPVADSLQDAGFEDPRIQVIRVDGEPRWILSYAFNAGFRAAKCERILKADADIILSDTFFDCNPLPDLNTFIAGNWRTAAADQVHVNGFFYTSRSALSAVGGFNEFITTYGWDDDDLYTRLETAGLARQDVAPETIHHLHHSDEERTGEGDDSQRPASDSIRATPRFMIQRNRVLCDMMPTWDGQKQLLPLRFTHRDHRVSKLTRTGTHESVVPDHVFDAASSQMLQELMSWDYGPEVRNLSREDFERVMQRPLGELSKQAFLDAMMESNTSNLASPSIAPTRKKIYIDAQHGLGNRLRAIGSAAAIAEATGRELVIVWEPDHHCEGRLHDLFDYEGAVIERAFVSEAKSRNCLVYNYMEIEEGSEKNALIDPDWSGDIYLRAAYVLNSPHSNWEAENAFLKRMKPVEEVRRLTASVRTPNDVSAHVRMVGGSDFEHLSYEALDNWTEEGHAETEFWRKKSHFSHFLKRIDSLISEGRADRVFLAADKPETYEAFLNCYGDRVAFLPREVYDRSAEQLRYALADALLLGSAPLLLGSTWSSFSELAMRLSPRKMTIEMSGKDF